MIIRGINLWESCIQENWQSQVLVEGSQLSLGLRDFEGQDAANPASAAGVPSKGGTEARRHEEGRKPRVCLEMR